jgi:hypothetical protein
MPANSAAKPARTTSRGDAWGKKRGIPTAASSRVIDSGSSRTPVAMAESPSATERNSGTLKKRPACSRYWKKKAVSPPRSTVVRNMAGSNRIGSPRSRRHRSHARNPTSTVPPAMISQITGDSPSHRGASGLGPRSPGAGAEDAVHDEAEPGSRQRGAHQVEVRLGVGGRVGHPPGQVRMTNTMSTSPANTQRQDQYVVNSRR